MSSSSGQPPFLLLLGAIAGMARAAIDKTRQKKKSRHTRTLTKDELDPLDKHTPVDDSRLAACDKQALMGYNLQSGAVAAAVFKAVILLAGRC